MAKAKSKTRRKPVSTALVPAMESRTEPEHPLAIIERVAKDKTVDVEKLGKLIDLQKDMLAVQAKADFENAFATMAPLLPVITKRGIITNKGGGIRNRYARLGEDIHPVIKPLLSAHGFALRHRTEWPASGLVRIVGVLSHRSGHSEESAFEGPADQSDYRSHAQSLGSTISYGRRYTTIDLLNITLHGVDDDGNAAPRPEPRAQSPEPRDERPPVPAGVQSPPCTEGQAKRLYMIVKNSGRDERTVKAWLQQRYRVTSYRDVRRVDYDAVCNAVEAPGDLPERGQ